MSSMGGSPLSLAGALLSSAPLLVVLAGCDDHHHCPEESPSIASFTSATDTVAAGADFEVTCVIENFELSGHGDTGDDHSHEGTCAGGHYHVYLDRLETNPLAMSETETAIVTMPEDAEVGAHTLIARLHNRDHTIVEPEVVVELDITVE